MGGYSLTRPIDALDAQVNLIRYLRSEVGAKSVKYFGLTHTKKNDHFAFAEPENLGPQIASRLDVAATYTINPSVAYRLWDMTKNFEPQPLLPQDLPEPYGFIYFDEPLFIYDRHDKIMTVKALSWSTDESGMLVCQFSDRDHPIDEISEEIRQEAVRTRVASLEHRLALSHIQPWQFGHPPTFHPANIGTYSDDPLSEEAVADTMRTNGFLEMFFDFVGDTIPRKYPPDRAQRRRLARAGLALRDVNVVELRALEAWKGPVNENPEMMAWTHRWWTRRHTRKQWYGSVAKGTRHQETIVIEPFVKGPAWAPLIETDTVFQVRR